MSAQHLTVTEAQDLCDEWRNKTSAEKGTAIDLYKGFLIPTDAVAELKANDLVEGIRVYLAHNSEESEVKLVVVGTKDDGSGNQIDIIGTGTNTMIYDFTVPCPSNCDTSSPLV